MALPLFKTYRFEHPRNEKNFTVGGWAYLVAGLFGAFWVLSCGLRNKFLYAFAITLCAWAGIVAFTGISLFLQPVQAIIFFVGACLVLLAIHSRMMVAIVVNSYRRRGWQVRAGD